MVTNLPAEARAKWLKVMEAKTPEEKLRALQEFLSAVPKHKGTENLVYWAKRRIAELREEIELSKRKGGSSSLSYFIEKEGAGQVLLLGDPIKRNQLMKRLTNVKTDPKEFPLPGMMNYEDVQIQLINPPLSLGTKLNSRIIGLARNADALLLAVVDKEQFLEVKQILEENGIILGKPRGRVIIERIRHGSSGIRIVNLGKITDSSELEIRKYLESFGILNALVKIIGEISLEDVEKSLFESITYKPSVVVTEKPFDDNRVIIINENEENRIREELFKILDIIRIYTKEPNEKPTKEPLILKRGSTVLDVAKKLHSQIAENLKYARVWGKSVKFQGQRVGPDHVLEDGDIVELHVK
jgi:ribosome-interacting GTPase 1